MRLILAPKSARVLLKVVPLIVHGSVKLPGSLSFEGISCVNTDEHLSFKVTCDRFPRLFLVIRSFMNFAYLGIFSRASTRGMLMLRSFTLSKKRLVMFMLFLFSHSYWKWDRWNIWLRVDFGSIWSYFIHATT